MDELIAKAKKLNEQIQSLAAKEKEADTEAKSVIREKIEAKKADFESALAEIEEAKKVAAEEAEAKDRENKMAEFEAKAADLADVKIEAGDNRVSEQKQKDEASRAYMLEGKSGLAAFAQKHGDNVVNAVSKGGEDGILVPSYIRDHILYNTFLSKGANPVVVEDASGTASGGGSLVPNAFVPELFKIPQITDRLMDRCWVKRAVTGTVRFPRVTQSTNPYGVAVAWGGEDTAVSTDNPVFTEVTVPTYRLGALAQVSTKELRENAVGLEAELASMMRGAVSREVSNAIINGTGSGQPTGININASITNGVNVVSRQTASQVSYTDIVNLQFTVDEGVMDRGILLMKAGANGAMKYVAALDDSNGRPVMRTVDQGWQQGMLPSIAGSELVKCMVLSNLGYRGDVIFGDFSCYGVAMSADVSIDMSEHYAFDKGLVTYRVMLWIGGKPLGESCFALLGDASGASSSSSSSS